MLRRSILGCLLCVAGFLPALAFLPPAVPPHAIGAARRSGAIRTVQTSAWRPRRPTTALGSVAESDDAIMEELIGTPWEQLDEFASKYYKYMIHPQFYMKFADRIYQLPTQEEQDDAAAKATKIWNQLLKVLNAAEEQRNSSASVLEGIVAQAAEADGQFYFPLAKERVAAVRAETIKHLERIDEATLAMLNAWVVKVQDDPQNQAMTEVLQKVFQVWAGSSLMRSRGYDRGQTEPKQASAMVFLRSLLNADAEEWDMLIYSGLKQEMVCTGEALVEEIGAMLQGVVLRHEEGSMRQRVQAEYLRELMSRVQRYTSENERELPF